MKQHNPDKKVGLITFNDEVAIVGDGINNEHHVITGERLNKFEDIFETAKKNYEKIMNASISASFENLTTKFASLQEKG